MKPKLDELTREVQALGPRGPGRRYPHALRARLMAWADAERRKGQQWVAISDRLGIPCATLQRWCAGSEPAFVPVVVREEPTPDLVSVVAPSGWRLEGLSLSRALELLGRTGC